jgi:hypothetical protein
MGTGDPFELPAYWQPAGGAALVRLENDIRAMLKMADSVITLDFWAAGQRDAARARARHRQPPGPLLSAIRTEPQRCARSRYLHAGADRDDSRRVAGRCRARRREDKDRYALHADRGSHDRAESTRRPQGGNYGASEGSKPARPPTTPDQPTPSPPKPGGAHNTFEVATLKMLAAKCP